MEDIYFPNNINRHIEGFTLERDKTGRSKASVYRFVKDGMIRFLKVAPTDRESIREKECLQFLKDKVPVPEILAYEEEEGISYCLMSALEGEMSCSAENLKDIRNTAVSLAGSLKKLWNTDITGCAFDESNAAKLRYARERIDAGLVDMDDLDESHRVFRSPDEIYDELVRLSTFREDLVFTHGDYCLPNVFIKDGKLTGFLDLGKAGVADRWQDIALCIRSMRYNFRDHEEKDIQISVDMFLDELGMEMDEEKYEYYTLLDELF